jgi:hypothetical protein
MPDSTLRLNTPAALSMATLPAQDITGTWQGTLTPADGRNCVAYSKSLHKRADIREHVGNQRIAKRGYPQRLPKAGRCLIG